MFGRRQFLRAVGWTGAGALVGGALPAFPAWAKTTKDTPPELIVRNTWPEHYETTVEALGRTPLTRNDRFFVRSHFPVPDVDVKTWRLEVSGLVRQPLRLTLDELKRLPQVEVAHTLECAGNGRGLYHLPSTSGTQWEYGAVGTALWRGTTLRELLARS